MTVRVILVCADKNDTRVYLNSLEPLGVDVDTVSSLKDLHRLLINNEYNGLMIDLKTKIRASMSEKELTHEILELFPVIQLRCDEKTESIRTLYFGQSAGGGTIDTFINEDCRSFTPRSIRLNKRNKVHFNIVLSKDNDFSEKNIYRTVTMDVSKGGVNIYSLNGREAGDMVSFIIKELDDDKPILGEVRWKRPWGKTMQVPGIGVKFENIGDDQLIAICEKGNITE